MDEHLDAIQYVAVGVMRVKRLVTRHLGVGVITLHHVIVDDDAEGTAHNLVVHHNDHLSLGEDGYKLLDLGMSPEHVMVCINSFERTSQLIVVLHPKVAQLYLVYFKIRFHKTNKRLLSYTLILILSAKVRKLYVVNATFYIKMCRVPTKNKKNGVNLQ